MRATPISFLVLLITKKIGHLTTVVFGRTGDSFFQLAVRTCKPYIWQSSGKNRKLILWRYKVKRQFLAMVQYVADSKIYPRCRLAIHCIFAWPGLWHPSFNDQVVWLEIAWIVLCTWQQYIAKMTILMTMLLAVCAYRSQIPLGLHPYDLSQIATIKIWGFI